MGFWDWFKRRDPELTVKAERRPDGGKLRAGKKHGRWVETEEREDTRWDEEKREFVKLGFGWRELTYVDGKKHGPFALRYSNGIAGRIGTYVDDKIEGPLVVRYRDGAIAGEGTFRAGELHGHWVARHADGKVSYESDYIDGKRQGPWVQVHEDGKRDEGTHEAGERAGVWRSWSVAGVLIEEGPYAAGKRHGAWRLRRADGSIAAEGEYVAGAMTGPWRLVDENGVAGQPRVCADESDLVRWAELESAVVLLAAYEATEGWLARAKAAFAELARPWQVTTRTDQYGQTWASAPIDASWQLRAAVGVPLHVCCYDELWSRVVGAIDKLPTAARQDAVAIVEAAGLRYPHYMPRDWLTAILDDEADDPRTRIVTSTEPGRELGTARLARLQRRLPHAVAFSLRECQFPDGFGALFTEGYPALEQLWVVRSDASLAALGELYELLARAQWVGKLRSLAIVDTGGWATDAQLATLLDNPCFTSLRTLTLSYVQLGAQTARALATSIAAQHLATIDLRDSKLTVDALTALVALPALDELRLRACELPKRMTLKQAAAIDATALRRVSIGSSLGLKSYSSSKDDCTAASLGKRLAAMPALAKLESLDLSGEYLDEDVAAELARLVPPGKLITNRQTAANVIRLG